MGSFGAKARLFVSGFAWLVVLLAAFGGWSPALGQKGGDSAAGYVGLPLPSRIIGTIRRGPNGKLYVQPPAAAAEQSPGNKIGRPRAPLRSAEPVARVPAVLRGGPSRTLAPGDVDPRRIIPPVDPHLDAVAAPSGFGSGRIWHVGPTREFKKPSDVAKLVQDGDTVEFDAAVYKCDAGVQWRANFLTLVGIGGRPVLDARGCGIPGGKGIWNPLATMHDLIVDNIEFTGVSVGDNNGAGIRYDAGGYLYITHCYFHDNQDGILVTPQSPTNVVVDHSEFARNGTADGRSHNMYIGNTNIKTFVLRFSYSHDAHQGHLVKSRAVKNYILYNRLADEAAGDSSYNIEIPQGGLTYIVGNIIQQSRASPNYGLVSYSAEGSPNPDQALYIVNNTFVNDNPAHGVGINLYDKGLVEAEMVNNLIVGINAGNLVGIAPGKMVLHNNLVTNDPRFFDRNQRNYALTAGSPAIDKGIDPGSAQGFSLLPRYEFAYPVTGKVRPRIGGLDIGALEYDPSEQIPRAPTLSLSAAAATIDFDKPATISWSSTGADTCEAAGDWVGGRPTSGTFTTAALMANKHYDLTCSGAGGTASARVSIAVNDSAQAVALGPYSWREIPHSDFKGVCAANLKDAGGKPIYQDNFGTGPWCEAKGGWSTGVYVPQTRRWYLMGGGGGRNYYGNELYAFNLATLKPEMVMPPTHISETGEYAPSDPYGSKLHFRGCNTILHLKSGGITIGRRGVIGSAAWDPQSRKIIIGPSGISGGLNCGGGSTAGGVATDMWAFDPFARRWSLLAKDDDRFGSVTNAAWFLDPATGIAYDSTNRNGSDRGGYLIDYSTTPPRLALVDNVWPFLVSASGIVAIDTVHHYALQLGVSNKAVAVYDLNGLSMTRYGTAGRKGTTGTAGGPGPLFKPDTGWTMRGDTSLLSMRDVGLTYNPRLDKFVAWANDDRIFFLTLDYRARTLDILTKHVTGNPHSTVGVANHFTYLADRNVYLAFAGMEKNLYFLIPPAAGAPRARSSSIPAQLKPGAAASRSGRGRRSR